MTTRDPDAAGRPLTERERAVLHALLSVDFEGVEELRKQAKTARVVGTCGCGCPSIDFDKAPGHGMWIRVNAGLRIPDSYDGLFLYQLGDRLGGIEYLSNSDGEMPNQLPDPSLLDIEPC